VSLIDSYLIDVCTHQASVGGRFEERGSCFGVADGLGFGLLGPEWSEDGLGFGNRSWSGNGWEPLNCPSIGAIAESHQRNGGTHGSE
jgi:hypothetical protein